MKWKLALLSAWVVVLSGANAAPLQSDLTEDYNSYVNEVAKNVPLEGQLQQMRFPQADDWFPDLTTPSALLMKRGQPEYVGGGPGPATRGRTTTTTPMPVADDEEESREDEETREETGDGADEAVEDDEEEDDVEEDEDEKKRSLTEHAATTTAPELSATSRLPPSRASSHISGNITTLQKLVDSVDPAADEDLLELMVRIAASPEEWQRIHNTLQALDQDLAASRSAVLELDGLKTVVKKSTNDAYNLRRRQSPWDEILAQQQQLKGVSDSDIRRAELERAGLLPAGKSQQTIHIKPGKNKFGVEQKDVFAGNTWTPSNGEVRQTDDLVKTWSGEREDKPRQENGYLTAKSKGKHKGSDGNPTYMKHSKQSGKNRMSPSKSKSHSKSAVNYDDSRRHGKVVLVKQDSSSREPPRRNYDDESHHGRVVYQEGEDIADNWSEMVNNRNMDMGRTADRWQQNLKTLRQQAWLRPSTKIKQLDSGHRQMVKLPVVAKNTYGWPRQAEYTSYSRWPDQSLEPLGNMWAGRDRSNIATKQWPVFPDDNDDDNVAGSIWPKRPGLESIVSQPHLSNAWPGQKPVRQWPQFTYHRVTSSPRELVEQAQAKQRARQRSAFIAVSVVNPSTGRNRSSEADPRSSMLTAGRSKAAGMLDPLEQQLLQLTARLATPWSHVRHLNNIKEQLKTMSKMKEKLWHHWLERQKTLRMNDLGFPRSARDVTPTTSRPNSQQ